MRPFRRRAHRFSPQAAPSRCRRAYAAPLILPAQTRQAERDKAWSDADARHREELSENTLTLLRQNTEITERVRKLSEEVNNLTRGIHEKGNQRHILR